jgi:two-component system sensor histidine kinase QseC
MSWRDRLPQSLRGRLAAGVVAGALLVLSGSFVVLHVMIRDALYRHLDQDMAVQMRAVAEYAMQHPGREGITEYMPQFRTRAHQDFFQIWDGQGRTLARSDSSAGRDLPRLAAVAAHPTYHDLRLPDGHFGRAVSQSFGLAQGDPRGYLTVVVAEETENLDKLEARIHFLLLMIAVTTTAAMLLIARYAVLRGLRPVTEFARSVERVDPEDPHARLGTGPLPAELRPVAASFSALLQRLLDALAREKRYARNVAHELRNPLAEIRLLADVGSASREPEACAAAIRDIGAVAVGMERIVDTLMALTRYEAGLEAPQPDPVDLAAELRRQADSLLGAAEQRGLTISLDLPGEVWVHVDSAMAQRMLANLLGNAVAHSPRGAAVQVALSQNGDLDIANPAPHLQPADLPRLGEQFYRVGHGEIGPHAGLGLSLALAIARILGVRLHFTLRDDGYLVASIRGFRRLGPSAPTSGDPPRAG